MSVENIPIANESSRLTRNASRDWYKPQSRLWNAPTSGILIRDWYNILLRVYLRLLILSSVICSQALANEPGHAVAAVMNGVTNQQSTTLPLLSGETTTLTLTTYALPGVEFSLRGRLVQKTESLAAIFPNTLDIANNISHKNSLSDVHKFKFTAPHVERQIDTLLEIWAIVDTVAFLVSTIDLRIYPVNLFDALRNYSVQNILLVSPDLSEITDLFDSKNIPYLLHDKKRYTTSVLITTENYLKKAAHTISKKITSVIVLENSNREFTQINCSISDKKKKVRIRLKNFKKVLENLETQTILLESLHFSLQNAGGGLTCN